MHYLRSLLFLILVTFSAFGSELEAMSTHPPSLSKIPESRAKAPIQCFLSATEFGLTFHQSVQLCTNAVSMEPIRCFEEIFQLLTIDQKIALCQSANSKAPLTCFNESFALLLTLDQRIKLCNGAFFLKSSFSEHDEMSTGPTVCFKKSLEFPLSQDQRVILCASADSDDPVRCLKYSELLNLSLDQRVRLCTKLSPSSW